MDYVAAAIADLPAIVLLLCSIACLFAALLVSLVRRIVPNLARPTMDIDPLDPLSYSVRYDQ